MLRTALERILRDYPTAKTLGFRHNPDVAFLVHEAPKAVAAALPAAFAGWRCQGSGGRGNFATVPWLTVFDPLITTTATRGYYVVYLFNAVTNAVCLSLNQGATAIQAEFGARAAEVLRERAALMRARVHDFAVQFETAPINLNSTKSLPKGYEAGHAFGRQYFLDTLPSEAALRADLQLIVRAYDALTHRGGLGASTEEEGTDPVTGVVLSIMEKRQYTYHKRIERNAQGARLAKLFHGTTCQACGFNFAQRYGELGAGFIEAHHLKPLHQLAEGVSVEYNLETDFAVLCANCHRMIHRMADVGDIEAFKALLKGHIG